MQLQAEGSTSYIHNLKSAFLSINATYNYIGASYNANRIGFFGAAGQAGQYTTFTNDTEYVLPVIKLPQDAKSITISFDTVTRLRNSDDVAIFWAKDISLSPSYPSAAYAIGQTSYNARANSEELKVNTLEVPNDADSFVGFFRIYPPIAETETPESIANDLGFTITFNR